MAISKDTELLAELLVDLASLVAALLHEPADRIWAENLVENMGADVERAKSDE